MRSEPPLNKAASLLSTTQIRQVLGRCRNRGASTTSLLSLYLSVSLARTRASGSAARPSHCQERLTSGARSRASAVPSFSEPLHQPGAGIPAGTDEMFAIRHLLSHGASWRRFTFCGYTFRPRQARNQRTGEVFTAFLPARAPEKLTAMSRRVASWRLHRRTTQDLDGLAKAVNPVLRGWFAYSTAFYPTAVIPLCERIDRHLMRWARWKYKRLARSPRRARAWLRGVRARNPELFVHWRYGSAVS
jgi:hypothetical protein